MTDTQTTPKPVADADHPESSPIGWRFLLMRRWLGYFAMLLVFSIVCVWLGNWQFDRRAEARAEIDRIDHNYEASTAELSSVLSDPESFDVDAHKWLPVEAQGEYVGEPVFARNRPGPDGVGSDLIQAFQTTDGRIFYVNRGWVPVNGNEAEASDFDPDLIPASPEGPITVEARLRASEPVISGRTAGERSVASINVATIAEVTGLSAETYTGGYGMLISETPGSTHGALPEKPERDEGPHLSYALQWYVFILIAGIGVGYAARHEYRTLNAGSDVVREQDRRSAARKKRRGPSDSDEEDALLDS